MGMDGGMRIPRVPALVIRPMLNFSSYPARVRAGIMMLPTAMTVAGLEPEMAAKNMQVRMPARASPPRKRPTQASMDLTR